MSDLDALVAAFQTQLSDVMETVVRTAMYEVTRLVEDGLLREIRRRSQEVESLRIQLQWAESKLRAQEGTDGGRTRRRADCAKDDLELSCDPAEKGAMEKQDDVSRDCGVKEEAHSVEGWARREQEVIPETLQAADNPAACRSPEPQPAEEDVLPAVELKQENVNKPSCSSVLLGVWSVTHDGETGADFHRAAETAEAEPKQTQEKSEELLRNTMKQDPKISSAYVFAGEQEDSQVAADPSVEMDSGWPGLTVTTPGLLQNQGLATEKLYGPAKTRRSVPKTEHELANSVPADVDALVVLGRDQTTALASPAKRSPNAETLGVTIKQEVFVDFDGGVENECEEKQMKMPQFSVKQHRVSSKPLKQNHVSHKATVQEAAKLQPEVGTGVILQAALQHLQRPMKRPSHTLSDSTAAAPSAAHSQAVNSNRLNRIPSTSKATPSPPPLSVQRVQLGDKPVHNRSSAPWISLKAHSPHANPLPCPDSNPHAGPRHLLRCGQCEKCFPHPSNLKAHVQTHTGERPFRCSLCSRSFTKLSNLKAHQRVHTGERPYCCSACGKCFTQKCNLKRHQRIHLDV